MGPEFASASFATVTLKVATVAGGALLTNLGTSIPWGSYIGRKVTVSDGTNTAVGYVGAVGTGETYGTTVVTNGGFTTDVASWNAIDATLASIAGGQSGNCVQVTRTAGDLQGLYQNFTGAMTVGAVYRVQVYVKSGTSGNEGCYSGNLAGMTTATATSSAVWTPLTGYVNGVEVAGNWIIAKQSATAGTMLFDEASIQRVLTPDATGCTIVSAPGGATQSWASNTGIDPTATFTVTIAEA